MALRETARDIRERAKTLYRDIRSLSDQSGFMSQKTTFLLDSTLGMINIEQRCCQTKCTGLKSEALGLGRVPCLALENRPVRSAISTRRPR